MVQAFGMMQLAQLALQNPDAAASIVAASGAVPPTAAQTNSLMTAPNLVDQPVLPGQPPQAVPATPALIPNPGGAAPPLPPRKPPTPAEPGQEGSILQQLFGADSPFSGVDAGALQSGGSPTLQPAAAPIGRGAPGASQLQQLLAMLMGGAPQAAPTQSLGTIIRGG